MRFLSQVLCAGAIAALAVDGAGSVRGGRSVSPSTTASQTAARGKKGPARRAVSPARTASTNASSRRTSSPATTSRAGTSKSSSMWSWFKDSSAMTKTAVVTGSALAATTAVGGVGYGIYSRWFNNKDPVDEAVEELMAEINRILAEDKISKSADKNADVVAALGNRGLGKFNTACSVQVKKKVRAALEAKIKAEAQNPQAAVIQHVLTHVIDMHYPDLAVKAVRQVMQALLMQEVIMTDKNTIAHVMDPNNAAATKTAIEQAVEGQKTNLEAFWNDDISKEDLMAALGDEITRQTNKNSGEGTVMATALAKVLTWLTQ